MAQAPSGGERKQARGRLRREVRLRITSPEARRQRRLLAVCGVICWPILVIAVAWIGFQFVILPWDLNSNPGKPPRWMRLGRDKRLRHLAAAEGILGHWIGAEEPPARPEPEIDAAERAGAPEEWVAWLRLRVSLREWDAHHGGPVPAEAIRELGVLRRVQPDEPLWELVAGMAAASQGDMAEAEQRLGSAVARRDPIIVPVLPAPWRRWANFVPTDPLMQSELILDGCRSLGVRAAAEGVHGNRRQAEGLLRLLEQVGLKLAHTRWAVAYPDRKPGATHAHWTLNALFPISARGKALAYLAERDPQRWENLARASAWQAETTRVIARATSLPDTMHLLVMALGIAMGLWALGIAAALLPVYSGFEGVVHRGRMRLLDVATPAGGRTALPAFAGVGLVSGIAMGALWCSRFPTASHESAGSDLPQFAGFGFIALGFAALVAENWHVCRLRRAARKAGDGVWNRRVRLPLSVRLFSLAGLTTVALASAVVGLLLTVSCRQFTGQDHPATGLLWPWGVWAVAYEDWTAERAPVAAEILSELMAAKTWEQARAATPAHMRGKVAQEVARRAEKRPGKAFAEAVSAELRRKGIESDDRDGP